jgi:hypothetical protein
MQADGSVAQWCPVVDGACTQPRPASCIEP